MESIARLRPECKAEHAMPVNGPEASSDMLHDKTILLPRQLPRVMPSHQGRLIKR